MLQEPDRRIGEVIDGRYRLVRLIGRGGMGVVYRAEHLLLQKDVALKLLHHHLRSHPRGKELQQRFLREARSLARLGQRHPHIAPVIDCGVCDDGTLYMALELLEGELLCDVIARGPMSPPRAVHVGVQVLRTLIHAHGKGIVHRDLKPDNVMLTCQDGREDFVKVLDFGIAKLLSEAELGTRPLDSEEAAQELGGIGGQPLTRAGIIFGTPEYLAPEQAQGQGVDQRTDLYAVGCVLWEMLTGRRPFIGSSSLEVISMHLTQAPDPPSKHSPVPLPLALDDVVLRAMAKAPEDRFASAEAFLRALDVVLAELGRKNPNGRALTPLLYGIRRAITIEARALLAPSRGDSPTALARLPGPLRRIGTVIGVRGALVLAAGAFLVAIFALASVGIGIARRPQVRPSAPPAWAPSAHPSQAPAPLVPMEDLLARLSDGRSCQERRSAALALLVLGDRRALPSLERAWQRAVGRRAPNACMLRDLEEAIEKLRVEPRGAGID